MLNSARENYCLSVECLEKCLRKRRIFEKFTGIALSFDEINAIASTVLKSTANALFFGENHLLRTRYFLVKIAGNTRCYSAWVESLHAQYCVGRKNFCIPAKHHPRKKTRKT